MTSNCYVVYDEDFKSCIVIDPASENALEEIEFIEDKQLKLDYIIITHEHTDHNWGVNALKEKYPSAKFICSELCNKYVKKTNRAYFLFYYDNPDYCYEITNADLIISRPNDYLTWFGHTIVFLLTPGHSHGSMCIDVDGMLFTGDTIMPFKPYFNGRDSNEEEWNKSIACLSSKYQQRIMVYPGHGDVLTMGEWCEKKYIKNGK